MPMATDVLISASSLAARVTHGPRFMRKAGVQPSCHPWIALYFQSHPWACGFPPPSAPCASLEGVLGGQRRCVCVCVCCCRRCQGQPCYCSFTGWLAGILVHSPHRSTLPFRYSFPQSPVLDFITSPLPYLMRTTC